MIRGSDDVGGQHPVDLKASPCAPCFPTSAMGIEFDPWPVVKLFTPDGGCTWLVTEIDPEEPNRLWVLADLSLGCCEYDTIWRTEIEAIRGRLGLPVERVTLETTRRDLGLHPRLERRTACHPLTRKFQSLSADPLQDGSCRGFSS
jgi:hypothetical protein